LPGSVKARSFKTRPCPQVAPIYWEGQPQGENRLTAQGRLQKGDLQESFILEEALDPSLSMSRQRERSGKRAWRCFHR